MDIKTNELEELAMNLLAGIKQVSSPSLIKKIILEVESLDEMIAKGDMAGELAKMLDESLKYPVFVREKRNARPAAGEYVISLASYKGGRFVLGE